MNTPYLSVMAAMIATFVAMPTTASAAPQQEAPVELSALLAEARQVNPRIRAARHVASAAAARVPGAGALPDPVLSVGFVNLPLSDFGISSDPMGMAMLQLGQMLPAPGVRGAREEASMEAHDAARWRAEEVELTVLTRLKTAFYELHFIDDAIRVLGSNRALLEGLAENARVRFTVGDAPQQDVLRAQTEITRLDEQLAGLRARRDVALAEINQLVQRPSGQPLTPVLPEALRALAAAPLSGAAFSAAALAEGMGNGFPSVAELQAEALQRHPGLRAQDHRIRQGEAELRLARRAQLPDVEVMLGYGRGAGINRMSFELAVPLPVFASRKQRQGVAEATEELAVTRLDEEAMRSEIMADVASRYSEVLRLREQIVLLSDGVIPQAQATLESSAAAYQAGRVEFLGLLEAQATLFRTEIEAARTLADFGRALSELEGAAGRDLYVEETR